jgi:hypothetical protein
METWLASPFESKDGALLGVGATPGARIAALNRSRLLKGSSVRDCSAMSPPTVEVVLSILLTSPLTVNCCGWVPTASEKFIAKIEAEVSVTPSRTCVWNPSFCTRTA